MSTSAQRWRRRIVAGFILAGLCMTGLAASTALAQQFGRELTSLPSKNVATKLTNKRNFKLPVALTPAERSKLSKLCLYVKSPKTDWFPGPTIDPMEEFFVYGAREDGEYWFIVASVDRAGRPYPSIEDVRSTQPAPVLKVIIDTRTPTIQIEAQTRPEGVLLQCTMQAQFPNQDSLRVVCKNSLGEEKIIHPMSSQPGVFLITPQDGVPLRVIGSDQCKNTANQPLFLDKLIGSTASSNPGAVRPESGDTLRGKQQDAFNSSPFPSANTVVPEIAIDSRINPAPVNPPAHEVGTPQSTPTVPSVNPQPLTVPVPDYFNPTGGAPTSIGVPPSNRTILPTTQAFVEYRVEQLGSSGIGKVQVYITGDQGQSWKLHKEDLTKRSPVEINLPGEGMWGVKVVLTNGFGFGGTPPRSGEAPSCWIEVDTTKPFVQLQPVEVLTDGAGLDIRWTANDKNLAGEPISLWYRTSPGSPWQPICRGLRNEPQKNEGHYRWAFPRNIGTQFYFKIEAVDQVGNVGQFETPNALVLDLAEPQATVIRVSGSRQ